MSGGRRNIQSSTFNIEHATARHAARHWMLKVSFVTVVAGCWWFGISVQAAEPTPDQIEFFENKIRPVLVDHCYSCHSDRAEKVKGGLKLDTREAVLKGGTSGDVIVPGDPDASLLIKAVRYLDPDLQMPPKDKKLSADQIASLEAWVKMGAPDPRLSTEPKPLTDIAEARARHWAFQPVKTPPPPKVKQTRWVKTPVDAFVLAKLEQQKLRPAPPADRRTLIRRVTYDLTGLPPTPEEVESFVQDRQPDAYAQLVDRLLASPHYGERWGRHWLDVARYADTKGYVFEEERRYAFSYTYRDYVIRAFNEDLPFDQFITQQIAADLLPLGEDKRPLAALGYLTLGRRFVNNIHDIIDDRIDVVSRGLLGLTVSCARCHDHKFDPIPTKDYYSLYGVFASSTEPEVKPLLGIPPPAKAHDEYLVELKKRQNEKADFQQRSETEERARLRQSAGAYLLAAGDAQHLTDPAKIESLALERKLAPVVLKRWLASLKAWGQTNHPIFSPWSRFAALSETNFAAEAKIVAAEFAPNTNSSLNLLVAQAFTNPPPARFKEVAKRYGRLLADAEKRWREIATNSPPPTVLPDTPLEALRQILYTDDAPPNLPPDQLAKLFDVATSSKVRELQKNIDALDATHPGAPPRAMALMDKASPANAHVFIRGNPASAGATVPRRFLEVLSGPGQPSYTNGSGRLELARAIASPDNPLTARVYVNRVWQHHFGKPLVDTPGDFGVRTEAPLHQALLDYLAGSFMANGWSSKQLHRLILLSATYRQSSTANTASRKADPENHYLHHANRSRLDFEELRDTLLALSGNLDQTMGGLPVDIVAEPFTSRRTVYGFIERQNLPGLFRSFDFASPDASNQGRFTTTVPQQALFLLNSPFVIEQARGLVQREEIKRADSDTEKIQALHRLVEQRPAEKMEIRLAEKFLAAQPQTGTALSPLEKYAQILLLSNELMFVD